MTQPTNSQDETRENFPVVFQHLGVDVTSPDGIKMEKVLRCEIAKGRVVTNLIMNGAFDRQTPLSVGMDGHGKKKKMDVFLTHRLPQKF